MERRDFLKGVLGGTASFLIGREGSAQASKMEQAAEVESENADYIQAVDILRGPVKKIDASRSRAEHLLLGTDLHTIASNLVFGDLPDMSSAIDLNRQEVEEATEKNDNSRYMELMHERCSLIQSILPSFPNTLVYSVYLDINTELIPLLDADGNTIGDREKPVGVLRLSLMNESLINGEGISIVEASWYLCDVYAIIDSIGEERRREKDERLMAKDVAVLVRNKSEADYYVLYEYKLLGVPANKDGLYRISESGEDYTFRDADQYRKVNMRIEGARTGNSIRAHYDEGTAASMPENDLMRSWTTLENPLHAFTPSLEYTNMIVPIKCADDAGFSINGRLARAGL